jgi:hypothetical protein
MRKIIPFAFIAAFALGLGACASGGGTEYTKGDAASAITAAEHETARAKKKGYEWRDTGKLLKKAKKAMKEENYAEAVKMANKAKRQSSNALAQAEAQANAGPNY